MGLSTAERNKRKRERKKKAKEEERKRIDELETFSSTTQSQPLSDDIEIEYVPEPIIAIADDPKEQLDNNNTYNPSNDDQDDSSISAVLRRFQNRASVLVSEDERDNLNNNQDAESPVNSDDEARENEESNDGTVLSKRKLREMCRPTIAELKNRVERADLVEAHDITSKDPDFLLFLKAVPSTVPVPRHWGRKRKYLQGKRGIEKLPFKLPDFIEKTGISQVRSAIDQDEGAMTAKRKNRNRVAPKMGALDVDYRTLYDAFFKHQNKASIQEKLTNFGDLYYEGKEFETQKSSGLKVGGPLSERLRDALGITAENSPTPWLMNMQRYGPPPSYPHLKIPGLNAPLPAGCSYGYHLNGWGKPPVDNFGRPLYGGNPFDPPGNTGPSITSTWDFDAASGAIVTSDGKTIGKKPWGALAMGMDGEEEEEEEEESSSSDEEESSSEESDQGEMIESEEEEEDGQIMDGKHSKDHERITSTLPTSVLDLRKPDGEETPAPSKQLYTVLPQTSANKEKQVGSVFTSDVTYVLPNANSTTTTINVPEGAQSVLSKAPISDAAKRKHRDIEDDEDEEENEDLGKKFKF